MPEPLNSVLDEFALSQLEELLARRKLRSCGLGADLRRRAGLPAGALAAAVLEHFDRLADGGLHAATLGTDAGPLRVYVRRRGRMLDAGTAADMAELGCGAACAALERLVRERGL